MAELKINNIMKDEDINWKKVPCKCDMSNIEKCFLISKCKHCECQAAEDSMPREIFEAPDNDYDDEGNLINEKTRTITEITICRSQDGYDSILGWSY